MHNYSHFDIQRQYLKGRAKKQVMSADRLYKLTLVTLPLS